MYTDEMDYESGGLSPAEKETLMVKIHALVAGAFVAAALGLHFENMHSPGSGEERSTTLHLMINMGNLASVAILVSMYLNKKNPDALSNPGKEAAIGQALNELASWKFAIFLLFAFTFGASSGTYFQELAEETGLCDGTGFSWLPDIDYFSPLSGRGSPCNLFNEVAQAVLILTAYAYTTFAIGDMAGGSKGIAIPAVMCSGAIYAVSFWLPYAPMVSKFAGYMTSIRIYLGIASTVIHINTWQIRKAMQQEDPDLLILAMMMMLYPFFFVFEVLFHVIPRVWVLTGSKFRLPFADACSQAANEKFFGADLEDEKYD
jgi:hypothetical protein